jgi:hypothetical protein
MRYTVYHLPGWKYGLTNNLDKRRSYYARHQTRLLRVVAELDDVEAASALEAKLNAAAGYRKQHVRYEHTVSMATPEQRAAAARLGGLTTLERGHNSFCGLSPEERIESGRKGGLKGGRVVAERKLGIHALPQEVRAANSRKGGKRAAAVLGPERLAENGRRMGQLRGVCPHCRTETNAGNLAQHHLDKCPLKIRLPLRRPA